MRDCKEVGKKRGRWGEKESRGEDRRGSGGRGRAGMGGDPPGLPPGPAQRDSTMGAWARRGKAGLRDCGQGAGGVQLPRRSYLQVSWGPGPCQGGPRMGGRPVEGKGGPSPAGVDEASGLDGGLHGIAPVLVG